MTTAEDIAHHIRFDDVKEENVVSYSIIDYANGDTWKEIKLIFNGNTKPISISIPSGQWKVIARNGDIKAEGMGEIKGGEISVEPTSALILAKE